MTPGKPDIPGRYQPQFPPSAIARKKVNRLFETDMVAVILINSDINLFKP